MTMKRCDWCLTDKLYIDYHDHEWGIPLHDDQRLFEMLILEGMQAGLSWITVLRKREAFRQNFDNFDPEKIAHYDEKKISDLLQNPSIIRNHLKIRSAIQNARAYLAIKNTYSSFDEYLWQFVEGTTIQHHWKNSKEIPTHTKESDDMAKTLKKAGFNFVGTTICYAFMQAVGMVNDHLIDCYRFSNTR